MSPVLDGLRLAVALLTVLPVSSRRLDRATAGRTILWVPAAGVLLGVAGAAVLALADRALDLGSLLPAALALGAVALLTRGLHLDGLADLADGLGSGRPADEALRVMRASDIGPFGVLTIMFVLIVQIAALTRATELGHGVLALVVAVVLGRLAIVWACRSAVPPARADGLGALVAGTVRWPAAAALTAAALAAALGVGLLTGTGVVPAIAVAVGLLVAAGLQAHAVRRLGGITGDVLGALVEVGTAAALVVMAVRPG